MPTKLLLVTGSYPPERCGVGDYSRQLATAIATLPGMAVSVLTTGTQTDVAGEDGVLVVRAMPDWSLRRAGTLLYHIRHARPDVVHVQYPTQGYRDGKLPWLIPLMAWGLGTRVVQTWHEGYERDLAKFTLLAIAPSRIIVVREAFVRQFGRTFGMIAGLRHLLHINGAATLPKAVLTAADRAEVRARYGAHERRLLVFFGFIHPGKQIEQLFAIANPDTDQILIVGNADGQTDYLEAITALTQDGAWTGHARVIGFAEAAEAAAILAAADALVLPLKTGGGEWNTAILAGILQGTFVLTTSTLADGYHADTNVYYARIDDLAEMRRALAAHAGTKRAADARDIFTWRSVAERHVDLYRSSQPIFRTAAA